MTINNKDLFFEGVWDWQFLDQCFKGTKIKVSDIDGIVERKGHFLVIETKKKGVVIPTAQERMYNELWKLGKFTVVYVWGNKNQTAEMKVCYPTHKTPKRSATNEDLKRVVSWWFDCVDSGKMLTKAN